MPPIGSVCHQSDRFATNRIGLPPIGSVCHQSDRFATNRIDRFATNRIGLPPIGSVCHQSDRSVCHQSDRFATNRIDRFATNRIGLPPIGSNKMFNRIVGILTKTMRALITSTFRRLYVNSAMHILLVAGPVGYDLHTWSTMSFDHSIRRFVGCH